MHYVLCFIHYYPMHLPCMTFAKKNIILKSLKGLSVVLKCHSFLKPVGSFKSIGSFEAILINILLVLFRKMFRL